MDKQRKIGVALGSGGARGWAHIGALLELNKLGIEPYCIAGTSIGSIAGALYAAGTLELAENLAMELNWRDVARLFLEVNFLRSGLVSGKNFMKLLKDIIPARLFSDLSCPLAIVATDLKSEQVVVFRKGSLHNAIRASISIPGVFTPVDHESTWLVDGGLTNPLPISTCREMGADSIIAIDINLRTPEVKKQETAVVPQKNEEDKSASSALDNLRASISKLLPQLQTPVSETLERWFETQTKPNEPLSMMEVLTRSFRVGENEITRNTIKLNPPEILIQPAVGDIMTLEFYRGKETMQAGRDAVLEKMDELEALLRDEV